MEYGLISSTGFAIFGDVGSNTSPYSGSAITTSWRPVITSVIRVYKCSVYGPPVRLIG